MIPPRLLWPIGGAVVLLLCGWWWQRPDGDADRRTSVDWNTSGGVSLLGAGGSDSEPPRQGSPTSAMRSPEALEQQLFAQGSLRGASLDGDWGRFEQGQLWPSRALRRRFDQLLTTLGEVSEPELRALVQAMAQRDLGPEGALAVLAVWDAYVRLQRQPLEGMLDPQDPSQWLLLLQRQQRLRREHLGPAWADVFYRDEENALRQDLRRLEKAPSVASSASPVVVEPWASPSAQAQVKSDAELFHLRAQHYGVEAAQRLADVDAEQAQWSQRLQLAQGEWRRLQQAPELSDLQRQAAIRQWVDAHFNASERIRVQALLGL